MQQELISEARSWLGVKFAHQGRSKLTGCDCIGLIIGVAGALALRSKCGKFITACDYLNYSPLPSDNKLEQELNAHLHYRGKDLSVAVPGDIALLAFAKNPQHLAIIGDACYDGVMAQTLIHAYSGVGSVCEHRLDARWGRRVVGVYGFVV